MYATHGWRCPTLAEIVKNSSQRSCIRMSPVRLCTLAATLRNVTSATGRLIDAPIMAWTVWLRTIEPIRLAWVLCRTIGNRNSVHEEWMYMPDCA